MRSTRDRKLVLPNTKKRDEKRREGDASLLLDAISSLINTTVENLEPENLFIVRCHAIMNYTPGHPFRIQTNVLLYLLYETSFSRTDARVQ